MTWVMWNVTCFRLETVLVSVQDRCMVCARRNIGSEIVLDTPDATTSNEAQVEAHFGPFGDSANLWQNLLNYRAHMHLSLSNDL